MTTRVFDWKKSTSIFFLSVFLGSGLNAQIKDTLDADDILKMSLTELMNVEVISASKVPQQIKDVSATVQVITADQIKSHGYLTLEEALSDLPGFQFRNTLGFNSYVFMRGVPNQNNLILLLVDGIQVNELNSGGFYGGGQFNLSDIERIEVVYGPASALYGTNALSGIVNIITKQPEGKFSGHAGLLAGSFNTGMGDFSLSNYNKDKQRGFSVSGMYRTSEKADLRGAAGDNNWSEEMENYENDLSLSAKFRFKQFVAGADYQEKCASMTTNFKSVGDKYLDKNTLWDIVFFNSYLKYSHPVNDKLTVNSTVYYRNATVKPNSIFYIEKATDSTSGMQVGYYRPNQLVGLENQVNYQVSDRLMVTGGFVTEFEQLAEEFSVSHSNSQFETPPAPSRPDILNNFLFSYYGQASLSLTKKISFIGGLRHDFSSYYGQVFTPRTGLVLNKDRVTVKLLYNRAFRAPKPWDFSYGIGNPDLKPEKMHSFEIFGSYALMDNLSFRVSMYKNLITDKLIIDTTLNSDRWINKDELNTFGFELSGNYTISDFTIDANYTYTDSYDQNGFYVPEIAIHTANAGITYSAGAHLKINLRTNYLGARKNPSVIHSTGTNVIDNALLFNGCISYLNLKGFDIQLKVNNILDEAYYHPSNRFSGRYRQPQRSVYLIVRYSF